MSLKVQLWGTRGSLPSPITPENLRAKIEQVLELALDAGVNTPKEIQRYLAGLPPHQVGGFGGNTPCVEVASGKSVAIIDAGSGIRSLGYQLLNGPCGQGSGEAHLFFTHFHWDHLMGLPFFTPFFIPGNQVHVYAVQPELPEVFKTVFKKPYFPLNIDQLAAKIHYHKLEPRKPLVLGDLTITPYQLDHPDPCWGYKIQGGGRTYSHCVDTECTRVSQGDLGADLPLYQNSDLMVFDSQYTLMETIEKINWGHAAASLGLDLAMREGIKRVVFMHFDPAASDEKIAQAELQARRYYDSQLKNARKKGIPLHEVEWEFAREGMVIEV